MNIYNSVSNTSDGTTDDELCGGLVSLEGSNLDDNTENHNKSTKHHLVSCQHGISEPIKGETNRSSATETITTPEDGKRAKQATNFVDGGDESLVNRVLMCFGEVLVELRGRDNATHDTLIVSEEQETRCCDNGDGETQRAPGHAHELHGRTARGNYVCRHYGVLMRLSELCSEYRMDCRSPFCQKE